MLKNIYFAFFKKIVCDIFCYINKSSYLCTQKTSRDGAVVARWAHNPKVAGSSPAPATKEIVEIAAAVSTIFLFRFSPLISESAITALHTPKTEM